MSLTYGRTLDEDILIHKHTLTGFDSERMVKVFFSREACNYVVMSWHCLVPLPERDQFFKFYDDAVVAATKEFWK